MPCRDVAASVEWITSDEALAAAAEQWPRAIGLDTEFQRTDTFFPRPALYQVASGERVFLIDPLALSDFGPLLELLEDRRVVKIMHACSEDLELLRHHFGAVPLGLFDTQLANAFVSTDYSISFTRLVAERLGVELVQHETRSDWLARPLTPEQIRYACEDVYYLPPLHESLLEALERTNRLDWFREEMDQRGRFVLSDPDTYYLTVKNSWRLSGTGRARLQRLTAWRERQAMAEDKPRSRIVRDEHLYHLASLETLCADDLAEALPPGVVRRYRDELLAAHREGSEEGEHPPAGDSPLGSASMVAVRELREIARRRAIALGMAPELLARKREVEACVRQFVATRELSESYTGWRHALVGAEFRATLERLL